MSIQDLTEPSPPDLTEAEFIADMAQLARSARWLWMYALHGNTKPPMPDDAPTPIYDELAPKFVAGMIR